MVLNFNPMDLLQNTNQINHNMVKLKTTFSFGVCLEFQQVKKTARLISKVLRVATETIRTRYRKIT